MTTASCLPVGYGFVQPGDQDYPRHSRQPLTVASFQTWRSSAAPRCAGPKPLTA